MSVLVAGAGINGISAAIWLQRAGHEVTVVDRIGPAGGTSFGNGGVLAAGAIIPVATPGIALKAPRMLLDPDQPLFLRWGYLPRLLPFLRRYLSHATHVHVRRYAAAMTTLLQDSVAQHRALAAGTGAERFIGEEDYGFGYASRAAFEADRPWWDLRAEMGYRTEVLDGAAYGERDPIYARAFEVVVVNKDHGRISDPGAYVRALAAHFESNGGRILRAGITGLAREGGRIAGLATSEGEVRAETILITLGAWSGDLLKALGLKIPLESERGYHIELVNPSAMPAAPVMVAAGKCVVTPMEGRIRMAGVVEFGGLEAGPSEAPLALLKRHAKALFPDLRYERMEEWLGHRPATASSLPVIGPVPGHPNVLLGFGHHHVGLTGGPKTGRILAGLVSGATPNIDLTPFDPATYA